MRFFARKGPSTLPEYLPSLDHIISERKSYINPSKFQKTDEYKNEYDQFATPQKGPAHGSGSEVEYWRTLREERKKAFHNKLSFKERQQRRVFASNYNLNLPLNVQSLINSDNVSGILEFVLDKWNPRPGDGLLGLNGEAARYAKIKLDKYPDVDIQYGQRPPPTPREQLLLVFMKEFAFLGKVKQALQLEAFMRTKLNISTSTRAFNILMEAFSRSADPVGSTVLFHKMAEAGLYLQRDGLQSFILAYVAKGDVDGCKQLIQNLNKNGYNNQLKEMFQIAIRGFAEYNHRWDERNKNDKKKLSAEKASQYTEYAIQLFLEAEKHGVVTANARAFNALLHGFAANGDITTAMSLFQDMHKANLQPDAETFDCLMGTARKAGDIKLCQDLLELMEQLAGDQADLRRLKEEQFTWKRQMQSHILKQQQREEEMISIGHDVEEKHDSSQQTEKKGFLLTEEPYREAMRALGEFGMLEAAEAIIPRMREQLVPFSHRSYVTLLHLFKDKDTNKMLSIVEEMKKDGLSPNANVYTLLLKAHRYNREIAKMKRILDECIASGVRPNFGMFDVCMRAYLQNRKLEQQHLDEGMQIYEQMTSYGYQPDKPMQKYIISAFQKCGDCLQGVRLIQTLRDLYIPTIKLSPHYMQKAKQQKLAQQVARTLQIDQFNQSSDNHHDNNTTSGNILNLQPAGMGTSTLDVDKIETTPEGVPKDLRVLDPRLQAIEVERRRERRGVSPASTFANSPVPLAQSSPSPSTSPSPPSPPPPPPPSSSSSSSSSSPSSSHHPDLDSNQVEDNSGSGAFDNIIYNFDDVHVDDDNNISEKWDSSSGDFASKLFSTVQSSVTRKVHEKTVKSYIKQKRRLSDRSTESVGRLEIDGTPQDDGEEEEEGEEVTYGKKKEVTQVESYFVDTDETM